MNNLEGLIECYRATASLIRQRGITLHSVDGDLTPHEVKQWLSMVADEVAENLDEKADELESDAKRMGKI